jgi:16S rRNA (guanine(527)-N(7))-methyltransferase RsmG
MIPKDLFFECAALAGLTPSEEAFLRFDLYARELVRYNENVNLTAITDPEGITVKHFADSLFLLKYVNVPEGAAVCDVGTGAGFPGACLKIARPDLTLTLCDSVNKKLEFLRFLFSELGLPAEIVHMRAEEAGRDPAFREKFDLAAARAVAALPRLSEYCVPLVKPGGVFAPLKGLLSEEEKRDGCAAARLLGAKREKEARYELPTGDAREIIIFRKISQTPTKYPRVSAQIAKSPLK